jgi:hypothetical protein
LKIYGSLGKCLEEIPPRHEYTQRAQKNPDDEDAQILRAQALKSNARAGCGWGFGHYFLRSAFEGGVAAQYSI